MTTRRVGGAATLDVVAVLAFVVIGRRNHDESSALRDTLETAAPFVLGVVAGWTAARAWRRPTALVTGLVIWPVAMLVGLLARRWVFERGTAPSFVVVATLFLGACFVGWRLVAARVARSGGQRSPNSIATPGTSKHQAS